MSPVSGTRESRVSLSVEWEGSVYEELGILYIQSRWIPWFEITRPRINWGHTEDKEHKHRVTDLCVSRTFNRFFRLGGFPPGSITIISWELFIINR
jgi:hypothetical protein